MMFKKVNQKIQGNDNIVAGGNVTVEGISPQVFAEYVSKLAVTEAALASFFKILEEQQVPLGDLDSKLREIAAQYKELLARLETVQSEDPQVVRLKGEARQAIEAGDYAKAEDLLNQAEARDVQAIEELEQAARQRRISAAASCAENATLQELQLRYPKAADYWQKAAALLPEEEKKAKAFSLNAAGYDLWRIAKYSQALPLFKQSLTIRREIGDREGEGQSLNNISQIYKAWGTYNQAISLYEQSLAISQEIGDRKQEGTLLNNISLIYVDRSDYDKALTYLEQSLAISRSLEIGDRTAGEGAILNNISQIYQARGDYATSLKYLEQSLAISQEIGNRAGEAVMSWNIAMLYEKQGDLAKVEAYMSRAVQLMEELGHPKKEECRKALEDIRAKLKGPVGVAPCGDPVQRAG